MTLSSTQTRNQYTATGGTGFDYTFKILDSTQLKVFTQDPSTQIETELTYLSDYTVSGAGETSGGRVSFMVAPSTGHTVTILRNVPLTQELDLLNNDPFDAEVLEETLDKHCMILQQQDEEIGRAVKVAPSSSTDPEDLVDELFQARADALTAQSMAETARGLAEAAEANAEAAEAKAEKWAEEDEDVEVVTGLYSAKHHAAKAAATAAGLAQANETQAGIAEVATQAEVNAGTDDARMVTPAKLAGRAATDSLAGVVELATSAEAVAGTDTGKAVTAAGLQAHLTDRRNMAILRHFSPGAHGGGGTAGTYLTRPLNSIFFDNLGVSLASNQITIPTAGVYEFDWWGVGYDCEFFCLLLYTTSGPQYLAPSPLCRATTIAGGSAVPRGFWRGIVTANQVFEIRHIQTYSNTTTAFGYHQSVGNESYLWVLIRRVS